MCEWAVVYRLGLLKKEPALCIIKSMIAHYTKLGLGTLAVLRSSGLGFTC